jgi:3-deoxy-D-manno-octulosonate 8-phosphate phosphatase KdsC-like HAD superfamily phosphatase
MLLILDVDGVLTDGTKAYGPDGKILFKRFADVDFTALKKFKENGWSVCFLSADKTVNEPLAIDRGIDFWFSRDTDGTIDKVKWLHILAKYYGNDYKDIIYVGDDLFDLPVMKILHELGGQAFCPRNGVPQMVGTAYAPIGGKAVRRLLKDGGTGAIMDLLFYYYPGNDPFSPPVCG